MTDTNFKDFEQAGWRRKADAYDDWLATITSQAIEPMLDAVGEDLDGARLLDICTGTGHLAGAADKRGATVEGLDFVDEMVAKAQANYPGLTFRVGDAEHLPYDDGTFDRAVCGFGHLHFSDADRAIREASRVLVPGGQYAFTVWCGPDRGGVFFQILLGAVERHGTMDVPLPPAPPMFRFADPEESKKTLERLGFRDVKNTVLDLVWEPERGEDLLQLMYKSIVRAPMLIECQTAEARENIHAEIVASAERHRSGGKLRINFPAALISAERS